MIQLSDPRFSSFTALSLHPPIPTIAPWRQVKYLLDSKSAFLSTPVNSAMSLVRSFLSPIRTPGHSMLHLLIAMVRGQLSTIYRYIHIRSRYLALPETCPGRGRSVMNTNALMSVSPHGLDSGQALLAASQYLNATAPYTACRNLPAPVS